MISNIGQLIETIENDEKLIAYIKQSYKEKTGEELEVPDLKFLAELQHKKQEEKEIHPNLKFKSFNDKVIALNLPDPNSRQTRLRLEKLRKLNDTKILIKKLDISHFEGKQMTPELLYKVLDSLKALKSVEEIDLSHNGLGDLYIDVINNYLKLEGLLRINLSFNNLTKASVKKLAATLKGSKELEFFDVSYNPFNLDQYSCMLICAALKDCNKIVHFGMNDSSRDSGLRFITSHPTLTSVNLEDSRYKKRAWATLFRILSNRRRYELSRLSLKFCKIDFIFATQTLIKAFKKNSTLKYLNLYNTGLDDTSGAQIMSSFCNHRFLEELDLGANFLSIHFCKAFGRVLRVNNILRKVNITKNNLISRDDYFFILDGLVNNQSIISFGNLVNMKIGVKCKECTEKLLNLNKCCEWRNLQKIKSQKANVYMSNVGIEHIISENKKLDIKRKEEEEKKESMSNTDNEEEEEENEEEEEFIEIIVDVKDNKNAQENMDNKGNKSNRGYRNINRGRTPNPNNKKNQNLKDDDKKKKRVILLPKKNSNLIDKLTDKLPQGFFNEYYQESLKDKLSYTNEVNDQNLSKDKILTSKNYNNEGKYKVPYSITGSHVIKDLKQYDDEVNGGKKVKKKVIPKSAGKFRRKVVRKPPPTIVNTIASIAQEIIDNDEELKEFKNNNPLPQGINENNINEKSEMTNNTFYRQYNIGNDEVMNYGNINLEEMQVDPIKENNIINKYNLIKNNFRTGYQEQVPFYY